MRKRATEGMKLSGARPATTARAGLQTDGALEKPQNKLVCFRGAEGESAWRESLRQKDKVVLFLLFKSGTAILCNSVWI